MAEKRYDLNPSNKERDTAEAFDLNYSPAATPRIRITPEMAQAMAHAATTSEMYIVGAAPVGEVLAQEALPGDRTLVVEAYITTDEEAPTPLLINYAWNYDGCGVWLEPDGGWHYQPGEKGYYPWKEI